MLFNSPQFALFFAVVYVACVATPAPRRASVLLAASLIFYGLWVPSALVVLLLTVSVNYLFARRLTTCARPRRLLVASISLTLATLATFKYASIGVGYFIPAFPGLAPLGANLAWLVLPLGISFYSFELISLNVDIHRGRLACPSFSRYVLFVTFFPHLIAGPIMRGGDLLPQLDHGGERTSSRTRRGIWLFVVGLVKKAVVSDYLLQPFVNEAFTGAGVQTGPVHLLGIYSFAFQIYADFSGYSDMARGIACTLGFELPMNFEEPYLSRTPSEFWRRWHMTLSRWLRDYLYVPLGGNRKGPRRTQLNLLLTMALGGLWHGAGLNFLAWGVLHGLLLVGYRVLGEREPGEESNRGSRNDVLRVFVLFNAVCLLWVPFRSPTWSATIAYLRGLFLFPGTYLGPWPIVPLGVVLLCAGLHLLERALRLRLPRIHARVSVASWGPVLEGTLLGGLVTLALLASGAGVEFIYFQF